jgi:hypothetical protein
MTTSVFQRRQAERYAQLLDEATGGPRHHGRSRLDEEIAEYVVLGRRVSTLRPPAAASPDPDFRSSLRAMLVATAEREGIGVTAVEAETPARGTRERTLRTPADRSDRRPLLGSRRTRGAIIVGIAAGTLALSGMSMASGDAVPGDPLYGVKRSTESARLALAGSDLSRGQTYLDFAKSRGIEAVSVRGNTNRLIPALQDMDQETGQGVRLLAGSALDRRDPAALDVIDAFVKTQRPVIATMVGGLSGTGRDRGQQSLDLLDQIGQRVAGLRAGLSCSTGSTRSDNLGPIPPICPSPSTTNQHQPASGGGGGGGVEGTGGAPGRQQVAPAPEATPTDRVSPTPADAPRARIQPSGKPDRPTPSPSDDGLVGQLGHLIDGL